MKEWIKKVEPKDLFFMIGFCFALYECGEPSTYFTPVDLAVATLILQNFLYFKDKTKTP